MLGELITVELFIKKDTAGYQAFLQPTGGTEATATLGEKPILPTGKYSPLEYGHELFKWAFQEPLQTSWKLLLELAARSPNELSVRLLLRLEPGSPLSELAWETLCAPDGDNSPISVTTAFSRFTYAPKPIRPIVWERPVRILLVVSIPDNPSQAELKRVDGSLRRNVLDATERRLKGRIKVTRLLAPSLEQVIAEVRSEYHVMHFLAPATMEAGLGQIVLADESGSSVRIDLRSVADQIALQPPHLIFLTLPVPDGEPHEDFPHSKVLQELASLLISGGVQSVVAIKAPIDSSLLTLFTEGFYQRLLDTGEIDLAVAEARQRVYLQKRDGWEWTWPVLFTRAAGSSIQPVLPKALEATVGKIRFDEVRNATGTE